MSKPSVRASSSIGAPPTLNSYTTPVTLKSRWDPRPHHDDPTVKTFDFAYLAGVAPPTVTDKVVASMKTIATSLLAEPLLLRTLLLIFGGCCSNVYTLESILTLSSTTGTLITFLQFLLIALYTLPSQLTFTVVSPPDPPPLQPTQSVWIPRFKKRRVPLLMWCIFAAQFVFINVLNNAAFRYKISLPLHIILRSAGPVASMCVGYVWKGRNYSQRKVVSVALLFFGVVLAALSDAGAKAPVRTTGTGTNLQEPGGTANATTIHSRSQGEHEPSALSQQTPGFILLTLALLLSSIMGIWSDTLYNRYGRTPAIASEQLFYGHVLSLPYFMFQYNTLQQQYAILLDAYTATLTPLQFTHSFPNDVSPLASLLEQLNKSDPGMVMTHFLSPLTSTFDRIPRPLLLLFLNSSTQIVCISGVHHLSTQTSALTVSIVLNIRKVVSLLLSIWLFGNNLSAGVLFGATLVFAGGGIYGIPDKKVAVVDMKKVEEAEKRRLGLSGNGESKKDR